jgi:hypothetical protein
VILWRCFAWDGEAASGEAGSPDWFPRLFQGSGRHDNPDAYGCLYVTDRAVSGIVEQLARFRGNRLLPSFLVRRRLPLAVAQLELDDAATIVDLDDPSELVRRRLRPSHVATRQREVTQPQALAAHAEGADAVSWWSTYEALWTNLTVFDRAVPSLRVVEVRELSLGDPALVEAAEFLGMAS